MEIGDAERFWGESAGVVTVSGRMMVNLWLCTVWLRWGIRSSLWNSTVQLKLMATMISLNLSLWWVKEWDDSDTLRSNLGAHKFLCTILPWCIPIGVLQVAVKCKNISQIHIFCLQAFEFLKTIILWGSEFMAMLRGTMLFCSAILSRAWSRSKRSQRQ